MPIEPDMCASNPSGQKLKGRESIRGTECGGELNAEVIFVSVHAPRCMREEHRRDWRIDILIVRPR